jgi:pimeloyl-ACP methyl ester carboxylesterase
MRRRLGKVWLSLLSGILSALLLPGCAHMLSPAERQAQADALARTHGWVPTRLQAPPFMAPFELVAYLPAHPRPADELTIYIEGDGLAWVTPDHASSDPTPMAPLGLRLALAQPAGNAAYLARPCQYVDAERTHCPRPYWTTHRFAPDVVSASSDAIDQLKRRFHARRVTLVGYSGGGALAALLAARRPDVIGLITVAGNLDHAAWTAHHHVSPLVGSLNPVDDIGRLQALPQLHLAGARDAIVPPDLTRAFIARFAQPVSPGLRVIEGFDHQCCWAEKWPLLWQAWWTHTDAF